MQARSLDVVRTISQQYVLTTTYCSGGVKVMRTWLLPFPNRKTYERMLNYSSFCFSAAVTGLFAERPDVIIASSPQLLVGLVGLVAGAAQGVTFCLRSPRPVAGILGGGGRGKRGVAGVSRPGPDCLVFSTGTPTTLW